MSIWRKLAAKSDAGTAIPVPVFGAALRLWLLDEITDAQARGLIEDFVSRQEPGYTLSASDLADLVSIRQHFDALDAAGKAKFYHVVESAAELLSRSLVTLPQARALLGVPNG